MKRDRESSSQNNSRDGSDSDDYHTKATLRTTMVRDVNYFECEEDDDDEDDQDVTMKYTNVTAINTTASTSQLPPPPPVTHSSDHNPANNMDIDLDNQTIDTRHYSLASGITDRTDHTNSSHISPSHISFSHPHPLMHLPFITTSLLQVLPTVPITPIPPTPAQWWKRCMLTRTGVDVYDLPENEIQPTTNIITTNIIIKIWINT